MTTTDRLVAPRAIWPFLVLLAVALFPVGWLGGMFAPLGWLLEVPLSGAAVHAVGHAGIFFALGLALLWTFPGLRRRPLLFFGLLVAAAVAQELFQLIYKQRPIHFDEPRDLVTDVAGMLAAWALARRERRA